MLEANTGNKLYFISDTHFGVPNEKESKERELLFCKWLDEIKKDASEVYLLGDIFDFWFEYKNVVPKGYVRVLGKLAELIDSGIKVHYFTGNHDMWIFTYFEKELGIQMHKEPITFSFEGKTFMIGHGDGLGPGDKRYKFLKKVFACKFNQRLFAFIHPWIGMGLAGYFSRKSRLSHNSEDQIYLGDDKEWLLIYCKEEAEKQPIDFFIFGHRHLKIDKTFGKNSRYINLGEWVHQRNYAVFENGELYLKEYRPSSEQND